MSFNYSWNYNFEANSSKRFPCATTTVYRSILLIKDVLQVLRLQLLRSSGRFQVLP